MSRKLDAAIAEELGYKVLWVDDDPRYKKNDRCSWLAVSVPSYSSNGNAMLKLDTGMRKRGYQLHVDRMFPTCFPDELPDRYAACFYKPGNNLKNFSTDGCMSINSLPKAVALASYRALTGEKWRPEDVDAEFWAYVRGEKPDRVKGGEIL